MLTICFSAFCSSLTLQAAEELIPASSSGWRYYDGVTRPDPAWQTNDFDDQVWAEGRSLLGYGDRDVQTQLSYGDNRQRKHTVAFFRRRFFVRSPRRFRKLRARICCDDGAVVYLNSREVHRVNMPRGEITNRTHALHSIGPDAAAERQMRCFVIDAERLVEGENLVAISVHQANPTSSDLALDFELHALETEQEVGEATQEQERQQRNRGTQDVGSTLKSMIRISP